MNHYFCKTIPCVYAYASTNPIYMICKEWYFTFCIEKESILPPVPHSITKTPTGFLAQKESGETGYSRNFTKFGSHSLDVLARGSFSYLGALVKTVFLRSAAEGPAVGTVTEASLQCCPY